MPSLAPTRFAAAVSLACASLLFSPPPAAAQAKPTPIAQPSSLPPNQPTAHPPTQTPAQPSLPAPRNDPKHAQVAYAGGILSVSADNSSLNQILRQISHETGMKITGGVTDERVFGNYGPALPAQVLATLLDGTGSNMLLLHRDGNTAAELVLTPRTGGPTPPNPNAAVFNDQSDQSESQDSEDSRSYQQSRQAPQPYSTAQPNPGAPPAEFSPNQANPSDASQPQSPNGVKTPQQIYEQLQRLRQQQQAPQ